MVHVFIDDSGDAGFKFSKGSTENFVIACCVFNTPESAQRASESIHAFRRSLGWSAFEEFRFSKTRKEIRFAFMDQIFKNDFFVRAIVIDKKGITTHNLSQNHENFYNYVIKSVLSRSSGTIQNASIKIDGSGGREYRNAVRTYLRTQINSLESCIMKDVHFVDSKSNQLIQLADMVAGCIRRSHVISTKDSLEYAKALEPIRRRANSDIWLFK